MLTENDVGVFDFLFDDIRGVQVSVNNANLRILARDLSSFLFTPD